MKINDVEMIAISADTRDAILADAADSVARDAGNLPAAAKAVAESTGMPRDEIIAFLLDYAPEMERDERKRIRKRAKKKIDEIRDAMTRAYVRRSPDELSRIGELEDEMEKERRRRAVRRAIDAEEGSERPPIASAMLDYAALMDRPPLRPLVPGLIDLDTLAMLYAPPATYKTFLALWIAACVALGHTWAGRPVERGPVLYIAAEGVAGIQKRVAALSWLLNGGKPIPDLYIYPAPVNLTSDADVAELVALVRERGFRLVVLDTLVKVAGGAEENDNTAMTRVTNAAESVKRAGDGETSVLLAHHSGKSGDYRGASALEGNVDTMLKLEGDGSMLILTAVKQKDGVEGEIIRLRAKPVAEHDTLVLEPVAPGDAQTSGIQAARIEEALAHFVRAFSETGATRSQFVDALVEWGVGSRSTVYGYVNDLIKTRRLVVTGSASRARLELARELVTFDLPKPTEKKRKQAS